MNRLKYIFAVALPLMFLLSCSDRDADRAKVEVKTELSLTVEPGKWTYFSLSDSLVKGTSEIGNSEEDRKWAARRDWDIAVSEGGIRTNGGSSGDGIGALAIITDSIYSIASEESLTSLDYKADTLDVTVIKPLSGR